MTQGVKIAGLYALAVLNGVRNIYSWMPSMNDLVIPLGFFAILVSWSMADARRRGYSIPLLSWGWLFPVAMLAVPGYLVWSRGWRGVGLVALNGVALVILSTAAMQVGGYVWFGPAWVAAVSGPR